MKTKGLVQMYIGPGKGKTTAAVGLCVRAVGNGFKVFFAQFLKSRFTGEIEPLKKLGVKVVRSKKTTKFTFELSKEEFEQYKKEEAAILEAVYENILNSDVVVLDEVLDAVSVGLISEEELLKLIKNRPEGTEIVLTGHEILQKLKDAADYISYVNCEKHPYEKGVAARKGIEF